jgi:hypothetical protein
MIQVFRYFVLRICDVVSRTVVGKPHPSRLIDPKHVCLANAMNLRERVREERVFKEGYRG